MLCLPAFQCDQQSIEEASGGKGNIADDTSCLANASLVSEGPSAPLGHPNPPPSGLFNSTAGSVPPPSPSRQASVGRDGVIRESLENRGLSPEVAGFLLSSWRAGTQRQYGCHLKRWMCFCLLREADPFQPVVSLLLEFMLQEFNRGQGRGYSSMNSLRSAVSSVATVDGKPVGQHPLVCRFMKAVYQLRPALPRYGVTWDPEVVLSYIKRLGPNRNLSTLLLSKKLTMLLLLQSGQRCQSLHMLDLRNMSLTRSKVSFRIGDPLKTSRPGHHVSELVFPAYTPDRRLCVPTTVKSYLKRTCVSRGALSGLLLTTRAPVSVASKDTLRRWVKDIMGLAGIDLSIFAPHSARSASISKAAAYIPLATIVKTIGWSGDSMFNKFYNKPVSDQGQFAKAVLS